MVLPSTVRCFSAYRRSCEIVVCQCGAQPKFAELRRGVMALAGSSEAGRDREARLGPQRKAVVAWASPDRRGSHWREGV